MEEKKKRIKILITVMTYPLPSDSHLELVCTAGIREDGTMIRLYPIDYRYRPSRERYRKYQWIELEVEKNKDDPRPESYRPVRGTEIKTISEPLSTAKKWAERRKYVLAGGTQTMCALNTSHQKTCSLGIVRPHKITDLLVEEADRNWSPKKLALFKEQRLLGPQRKALEKIPYKFSYKFTCRAPDCNGHIMMIEDWEIGQLYRRMKQKYNCEKIATEKVKQRFYDVMCAAEIDTHFFVGTTLAFGTWVILGVFWPPIAEATLFD
jgi:hypothetical protein